MSGSGIKLELGRLVCGVFQQKGSLVKGVSHFFQVQVNWEDLAVEFCHLELLCVLQGLCWKTKRICGSRKWSWIRRHQMDQNLIEQWRSKMKILKKLKALGRVYVKLFFIVITVVGKTRFVQFLFIESTLVSNAEGLTIGTSADLRLRSVLLMQRRESQLCLFVLRPVRESAFRGLTRQVGRCLFRGFQVGVMFQVLLLKPSDGGMSHPQCLLVFSL